MRETKAARAAQGSWRRDAMSRPGLETETLRALYDRVAHRYDAYHALVTAGSDQRGRRLLVARCVNAGDHVLDAGAGTGSTAALAARAVGPAGSVVLLDLSPLMLQEARRRLREDGLERRVRIEIGDILHMPFADGAFDVVLSTYSACPLTDPRAGASEMYRVLRPGGLLGIAHSCEPSDRIVRWLAARVEDVVWRWPGVSLGCRSVSVLPGLRSLGAEVVLDRRIGVPLWPFRVLVFRKPSPA